MADSATVCSDSLFLAGIRGRAAGIGRAPGRSMKGVRNYDELDVWRLADEVRCRMRPILDRRAFTQHGELREQMEKCSERPCPQIAEGFARYLPRDNAKFVRIAHASLAELLEHLSRAQARQLVSGQEAADLRVLIRRASGAAKGYLRYLQTAKAPHIDKPPRRRRRAGKRKRTLNREP